MSDLRRLRKARLGREIRRSVDSQNSGNANHEHSNENLSSAEPSDKHQQPTPYHRRPSNRYQTKKPDEVLADWTIAVAAFTGVLALASVASDVFSYKTLRAINGQLHEMQTGGAQTDQIIAADKALADAAKAQAAAADNLAKITRGNIELSQRAWLGPNGATINAAPSLGQDSIIVITYQNSGKEPAIDSVITTNPFTISIDHNGNSNLDDLSLQIANCKKAQQPKNGQVVYPNNGFSGANQIGVRIDKTAITDRVIKKQDIIGVTGCIVYRSFGLPRHSFFCFFYDTDVVPLPNLGFCRAGGFAD